jgi:TfoX/Sxy family transcriptional regulator of competence genes
VKIPKPSEDDKERFRSLVPDAPGVTVKPMFGNLGAFVNGNMFMGLFGSTIGVRLPDDQNAKLLAQPGSGPFGPEERPMGGYAVLPADWSTRKVNPWIDKALTHIASLPPKSPTKRAAANPKAAKKATKKAAPRKAASKAAPKR